MESATILTNLTGIEPVAKLLSTLVVLSLPSGEEVKPVRKGTLSVHLPSNTSHSA